MVFKNPWKIPTLTLKNTKLSLNLLWRERGETALRNWWAGRTARLSLGSWWTRNLGGGAQRGRDVDWPTSSLSFALIHPFWVPLISLRLLCVCSKLSFLVYPTLGWNHCLLTSDWSPRLHVCVLTKLLQLCLTLRLYGLQPARLLCPGDSPCKDTGVDCHGPLGDLPNPGIKPALLISPALLGVFFTTSAAWKAPTTHMGVARALFFCFWGKHDIEIESIDVLLGVFLVSPSQSHPSRMAIALTVLLGSVKTSSGSWEFWLCPGPQGG